MSVLVIDVGTSTVRASVVDEDATVRALHRRPIALERPSAGIVEFDASALGATTLEMARSCLSEAGPVDAVGITAQRSSTIVWDKTTGVPIGPAIGWQDLRTAGTCLALQGQGLRLSPNQSATKLAYLIDRFDPARERELCFGTVECFIAWTISSGQLHVSDPTNAGVTGLLNNDATNWDETVLEALHLDPSLLPRLVDSTGVLGPASALPGAPLIAALCGDQQASLIGQGGLEAGQAKATFGSGGMLDCCVGTSRPTFAQRGLAGCFPIVAWQEEGIAHWGIEAIMLSAGTCIEWLRDGLGIIDDASSTDHLAASVHDAGGVTFVPALGGMGTPAWDFGARGAFIGLSASTSRAEIVHAVLAGIAHRGADLLEAAEADAGLRVEALRVDGGMSANATFNSLLAAATQRPIAPSPVTDATTLGAGFLAGVAVGTWSSLKDAASLTVIPAPSSNPRGVLIVRAGTTRASRALHTVPALSALAF